MLVYDVTDVESLEFILSEYRGWNQRSIMVSNRDKLLL